MRKCPVQERCTHLEVCEVFGTCRSAEHMTEAELRRAIADQPREEASSAAKLLAGIMQAMEEEPGITASEAVLRAGRAM